MFEYVCYTSQKKYKTCVASRSGLHSLFVATPSITRPVIEYLYLSHQECLSYLEKLPPELWKRVFYHALIPGPKKDDVPIPDKNEDAFDVYLPALRDRPTSTFLGSSSIIGGMEWIGPVVDLRPREREMRLAMKSAVNIARTCRGFFHVIAEKAPIAALVDERNVASLERALTDTAHGRPILAKCVCYLHVLLSNNLLRDNASHTMNILHNLPNLRFLTLGAGTRSDEEIVTEDFVEAVAQAGPYKISFEGRARMFFSPGLMKQLVEHNSNLRTLVLSLPRDDILRDDAGVIPMQLGIQIDMSKLVSLSAHNDALRDADGTEMETFTSLRSAHLTFHLGTNPRFPINLRAPNLIHLSLFMAATRGRANFPISEALLSLNNLFPNLTHLNIAASLQFLADWIPHLKHQCVVHLSIVHATTLDWSSELNKDVELGIAFSKAIVDIETRMPSLEDVKFDWGASIPILSVDIESNESLRPLEDNFSFFKISNKPLGRELFF